MNRSRFLSILLFLFCVANALLATDNSHWSRQFPKPQRTTKMSGATGMSDGTGKPTVKMAKWYKGKLYLAGRWENSLSPTDSTKKVPNMIWHIWTWHPKQGYQPIAWKHSAKGGPGPHGMVNDFIFLPDGRLVVGGEFNNVGNSKGHTYHRVKGLAVYNPSEPTANRWQPLVKSVQHNSPGNIQTLAYDPQAKELWVGGSFKGFRMENMEEFCFGVQRYNFEAKQWKIMVPGVRGGRGLRKIKIDTSTKPSTIYMAGRFSHTGGNGIEPKKTGSTDRYTEGFCAWQDGKGWITFPANQDKAIGKEGPLRKASDFAFFDSVNVLDFLLDGKDIWIVGAFSEGKASDGKPLRGIAKWDHEKQMWIDPTGKGGLGREAYSIAKAADGKIYVAGAFGSMKSKGKYYDGFKNGDQASMAICYDPATKEWSQLGDGLSGVSMPVCRVTTNGNDVFFYGLFKHIGQDSKKGIESYYLARWNSTIDFSAGEAPLPAGADKPFDIKEPSKDEAAVKSGMEHWSRFFAHPPRMSAGKTKQSAVTGMDDGVGQPGIRDITTHEGKVYFAGNWEVMKNERWFVWMYDKESGWSPLAFKKKTKATGFNSPPEGLAWKNGKLYAWGSNETFKGIGIYDPSKKEWSKLKGTYKGTEVIGNAVANGNPAINDVKWDSKTGDMYMVGSTGLRYEEGHEGGTLPASVIKVDKNGEYHPMGLALLAQLPSKPIKGLYCMYIDETKTPSDLYVGGTFGFCKADSDHKNYVFNVAKWNHEEKDWRALGKGVFRRIGMHDKKTFPEGYPGIPAQPVDGFPTFLTDLFPRVRCLTMDKAGNLYAGGSIGILDDNPDVTKRVEHYGIVKYNAKTDKWEPCTKAGGVSRDIFDMTWLDDTHLLLSGGFLYAEDYSLLSNVAILDTASGELSSLGGGLHKGNSAHVISMNVHHAVDANGYWFGGMFKYAGVDSNSSVQAPIESNYIAFYNPKENLDPNKLLKIADIEPVKGPKGPGSESRSAQLKAEELDAEAGTILWYKKGRDKYTKIGQGSICKASFRVKKGMTQQVFYACIKQKNGVEGSKVPVIVPIQ